jgi:GTP-binding protein
MSTDGSAKLFRGEVKFIAGAAKINQLPKLFLPEIAFIGKSNVGKSTLINTICNNQKLAKVSHTPGRTQQINFFSLAEIAILVDLPGYGFAKVPAYIREQWEKLILYYFQNRENLRLVNLLIDARRGIKDNDKSIIKLLLSYGVNLQIVFTKVDKINFKDEIINESKIFLESLGHSCNVICTSSRSKEGAKELQYSVAKGIKQR